MAFSVFLFFFLFLLWMTEIPSKLFALGYVLPLKRTQQIFHNFGSWGGLHDATLVVASRRKFLELL